MSIDHPVFLMLTPPEGETARDEGGMIRLV
jgi:hypothetical protein